MNAQRDVDVLIVGAGLSGINMAHRIQEACPELSYAIVERRERIGGTWDLFRYPGVRSDSDFFTLAFPFRPWRGKDSIVDGDQILEYLDDTARESGIDRHISFGRRVDAADWSSEQGRWTVEIDGPDGPETWTTRFLIACTGYYDYDEPYDPGFVGLEDFGGTVVHPQFWPEDLDYAGKQVVVIGSGATAVTIVPAMAERAEHVTMLQRTPSYLLAQPKGDPIADVVRKVAPPRVAHHVVRTKNMLLQWTLFQACQRAPRTMRKVLLKGVAHGTGSAEIAEQHFNPPYDPWDQRLCVTPQGDIFASIKSGDASVVTGRIDRFVEEGVRLEDGTVVPADVVVTATGLSIKILGGARLTVDGALRDPAESFAFHGAMLTGLPNFAFCVGYINLSWTMRSDLTSRLVARVLRRLIDSGATSVVPVFPGASESTPLMDMESGYLQRGAHLMPRATSSYPWSFKQNFLVDSWSTNRADLDDGLSWTTAPARAGVDA
ncbi:flavin-containing monooxygenase [Aeromicrobium duanguangcaii]|uniref:NAD(P)/FAD-dependent oxidoreductase n=1 Tax=Aeromicrobium duanguangcaii TaxID=2968086 RepID=A0ABY5KCP8_9ACTN|nr:NAD(P)/FAD-dependent oxidoreductase [Aeromicrobium duanguangcaii]MCD9155107.1 NAD(P)/FAD-dependent oxidoreductase [Aeromicrobium duanguangcaii]MCL3838453.1 NAD(P)/FAD-dependent oxidoreductase [Aeromicrobium duanguangcaii]UUI68239.1 NAD(P)/FAD-dependent oxidoreductase [Aeromicrobium duanguangcaii]